MLNMFFFSRGVQNVVHFVGTCVVILDPLENTHVRNTGRTLSINTEFNKRDYRCMTFQSESPPIPAVRV